MIGVQDLLKEQCWGRREVPLPLSGTDRLHVKRGVPEHRDSWAPTGSPALTPGLDPRHRDLSRSEEHTSELQSRE